MAEQIGPEVLPERISGQGVTIHGGCRLFGEKTLILPGAELGAEAPVTVKNCWVGPDVKLQGGYFEGSCFLQGASMSSGAQVRSGCLLEEGARGGHTVGLKQTILLPFVTLGSLVNFCDCLMAGGTDEKNHSEVGLIGDVPRGVMMNQRPIFLGGQGGLVGPVRITYGVVVAAGAIVRKDLLKENTLLLGSPAIARTLHFRPGIFSNLKRIVTLNTIYMAQLVALRRWYVEVRSRFMDRDPMDKALFQGALETLDLALNERLRRLGQVAERLGERDAEEEGGPGPKAQEFHKRWGEMDAAIRGALDFAGNPALRESFLECLERRTSEAESDYLGVIRGLTPEDQGLGTRWLQGVVDETCKRAWAVVPGLGIGGA
ncbi:MAG: UDP-N-acetylglucosamine pyrophosphorylase [Deltaproteobacteria bacterium]|nr:UDP-N-acetylglucosamine pyrophosphorylase [Deltaproteobacteria bacterium]